MVTMRNLFANFRFFHGTKARGRYPGGLDFDNATLARNNTYAMSWETFLATPYSDYRDGMPSSATKVEWELNKSCVIGPFAVITIERRARSRRPRQRSSPLRPKRARAPSSTDASHCAPS